MFLNRKLEQGFNVALSRGNTNINDHIAMLYFASNYLERNLDIGLAIGLDPYRVFTTMSVYIYLRDKHGAQTLNQAVEAVKRVDPKIANFWEEEEMYDESLRREIKSRSLTYINGLLEDILRDNPLY